MLKISHLQKHYRGFSLDCSMEVQPGMITAWDDYRTYWKKWFREIHHI